jgi:hypothetical protein
MTSGADYNRAEELRARKDGATLVKNSGRGMRKGDARIGSTLIDYKFTESKSFSINVEKFKEFEKQAYKEGYDPVIVAIFEAHKGKAIAMVDWDELRELLEIKWQYEELCK